MPGSADIWHYFLELSIPGFHGITSANTTNKLIAMVYGCELGIAEVDLLKQIVDEHLNQALQLIEHIVNTDKSIGNLPLDRCMFLNSDLFSCALSAMLGNV
jgi:hypothetical protein